MFHHRLCVDTEVEICQYANETALFFKADKNTVTKAIDIFHWYRVVSGLLIIVDTTTMVKTGACRAKSLNWATEFEALGIIFDVLDITEINISKKNSNQ